MAEQLKIVATLKVKPESRDSAIENIFKPLVEKTRLEAGCVSYLLHNDVKDKNTFIFVEEWRSQADVDSHMSSPHFVEASGKFKDILSAPPQINIIKPLL